MIMFSKPDQDELARWLQEKLGLTQHPDKTHITHWDKRFRFLGYDLRGQRNQMELVGFIKHPMKRNENSKPK